MSSKLMSAEEVRDMLRLLTRTPMDRLSQVSGVPIMTLYRIKSGATKNPGIETVRKFLPHVWAIKQEWEARPRKRAVSAAQTQEPDRAAA